MGVSMSRFWKFSDGFTLYFDAPDAGSGGGAADDPADAGAGGADDDHPDFAMPGARAASGDDAENQDAGNAAGDDPDDAASGEGDQPGRRKGGKPEFVPIHRLDEVIQQRDQLNSRFTAIEAENKRFRDILAKSLGLDPANPDQPRAKELTDREKAIQARIYELVPELKTLKTLAEKQDALIKLADSAPDVARQTESYWKRVATTMFEGMEATVAPTLLGDGKTVADLAPATRQRIRQDFVNWIGADPKREERYEALDRTLIDDFRKDLEDVYLAPVRRQSGAATARRAAAVGRLPVSGASSAPTTTPKPKAVPADEDAAADAAWKQMQEAVTAAG